MKKLALAISLLSMAIFPGCNPRGLYWDYEILQEETTTNNQYVARVFLVDPGPLDGYYTYVNLLHQDAKFNHEKNGENVIIIRGKENLSVHWSGPNALSVSSFKGDLQSYVRHIYGIDIYLETDESPNGRDH